MGREHPHFALIGDGIIANRHKVAIETVGGVLRRIYDPRYMENPPEDNGIAHCKQLGDGFFLGVDYVVICSPTQFHREQAKRALTFGCKVICEKPFCLPWEQLIDDDNINICLQLRYIRNLPERADLVRAVFYRNEEFFKSWKGDPQKAGGNIYEFFIHYIDLAILLRAAFEGVVFLGDGPQSRRIYQMEYDSLAMLFDLMTLDMQELYNRMYEDILSGGGVKPKHLFYLNWVLMKLSERNGYRVAGIDTPIYIGKEFLN